MAQLLDQAATAPLPDARHLYTELQRHLERAPLVRAVNAFRKDLSDMPTATRGPYRDVTPYGPAFQTFRDLIANFRKYGFAAAEIEAPEVRALQSEGGTAYGATFHDQLTIYERTATPMLNDGIVSISNVRSGEQHIFPRLTADVAHGGTVTAEAAAINELDATISSKTVEPFKYAVINLWSTELDQDNTINLERALAFSTGRELALDIGTHLTTGDGSSKPEGFITAASNGGTASGGTATQGFDFYAPADLPTLYMAVAAPYRARGTWQVSTTMFQKILEWRDGQDNPIAWPLNDSPSGLGLYARPLVENPAMAAVASATKSSPSVTSTGSRWSASRSASSSPVSTSTRPIRSRCA